MNLILTNYKKGAKPMETLKRINLSRVCEMFEIAGQKPSHGILGFCIMDAVCYPDSINDAIKLGFDHDYINGVIDGFDDWYEDRSDQFDQLKYRLGRADGAAARKIVGI